MRKYLKFFIYFISFIAIMIIAIIGYQYLSKNYLSEELKTEEIEKQESKVHLNKASDFTVLNNDGEKKKLSDFFGKPIIVNFWASWCGPCKAELPEFDEAYIKYGKDTQFLMINLTDGYNETVENIKKFVKDNNYHFPVYYDTQYNASSVYNVYSIPQTIFINKNGEIVESYIGMITKQVLEENIKKLIEI